MSSPQETDQDSTRKMSSLGTLPQVRQVFPDVCEYFLSLARMAHYHGSHLIRKLPSPSDLDPDSLDSSSEPEPPADHPKIICNLSRPQCPTKDPRKSHDSSRRYGCQICGKHFPTSSALEVGDFNIFNNKSSFFFVDTRTKSYRRTS